MCFVFRFVRGKTVFEKKELFSFRNRLRILKKLTRLFVTLINYSFLELDIFLKLGKYILQGKYFREINFQLFAIKNFSIKY